MNDKEKYKYLTSLLCEGVISEVHCDKCGTKCVDLSDGCDSVLVNNEKEAIEWAVENGYTYVEKENKIYCKDCCNDA